MPVIQHAFVLPMLTAVATLICGAASAVAEDRGAPPPRPNIVWISCEDISPHLGCYGDPHAITPNLDRLAAEGVRYSHAFTAAGVCAPNRSSIITGMYQNSIGTHHMRCDATLPPWLKPFPIYLRQAGYYCTNNSKTDYQFSDPAPPQIWDQSNGSAHWRNRPAQDQPFFAVFNFTGCHESGIASESKYRDVTADLPDAYRQDAAALSTLPPYYPDTPITREDWKRNYELITAMDAWAGNLIDQLKQAGLYEQTIIFFWSDHGVGLPRAKRWLYDSGTHVPLLVRIPEAYRSADQGTAGSVDDQLINSVDLAPTVLNLAGVPLPDYLQGRAFLGPDLTPPRAYAYGAQDRMDERYDIVRSVRDARFRYIRNFEPLKPYYQYLNTAEKGATMREIRRAQHSGSVPPAVALFTAATKPIEELYDAQQDPHHVRNLASDPAYADKLREMRTALAEWQNRIGDVGLIPEAEIELQERAVGSRYAILHPTGVAPDVDRVQKLVSMATKASLGGGALADLQAALADPDPSVRYWGATGIGNIGPEASAALPQAQAALKDPSPSVRIAAARAVARLGRPAQALPTLVAELEGPHQWGRLAAAIVLDEMDRQAQSAEPNLRRALVDQPNKYIVRVANRALNELLGTDHQVP